VVRALRVTVAAFVATGLLTGCGVAASKATKAPTQSTFTQTPKPGDAGTVTVWLPTEAGTWAAAVAAATAQFHQTYPNVGVQVSYRTESRQLSDFASAAFASASPTVIAINASDAYREIIAGALTDVTTASWTFDNRAGWNSRLVSSCTNQTKLYCVPFTSDLVLAVPAGSLYGNWANAWLHAATSTSVQHMIMGD
jgi:ABC-type glycerol-3-phosphate transport system substrate-binding protein